jgi:hypothetical protein
MLKMLTRTMSELGLLELLYAQGYKNTSAATGNIRSVIHLARDGPFHNLSPANLGIKNMQPLDIEGFMVLPVGVVQ